MCSPPGQGDSSLSKAFISLLVLFVGAVQAHEFNAGEYFSPSTVSIIKKTGSTDVTDSLANPKLPGWVRVSVSGSGLPSKRFRTSKAGLEFSPDKDSKTVEAVLNTEITQGCFKVEVTELAVNTTIAWHISTAEAEYLIEVKRLKADQGRFRIRVFNGRRFMLVKSCNKLLEKLTTPFFLSAKTNISELSGTLKIGKDRQTLTANLVGTKGFRAGLAVSDSRARVKDLSVTGAFFSADWKAEASAQMFAERALANLSLYAREGATRGLFHVAHPDYAKQWQALSKETKANWKLSAADKDFAELEKISGNAGGLRFEVAKLAVSVKDYATAASNFEASFEHSKYTIAKLAAIESRHTTGQESLTIKALNEARKFVDIDNPLEQAEFDLMLCRYRVAKGEGLAIAAPLVQWADNKGARPALQAFARSAGELMQPSLALIETPGPFGMKILSDLPQADIEALLELLKPIESEIKNWISDEHADCSDGYLVIYSDPVRYLTAALLPAGNNLDHVAGMFMKRGVGDARTILACGSFGRDELYRTLSHEIWHMVVSARSIPRWLDEGMAMRLSTAAQTGTGMNFGGIPSELDEIQRKQVFKLTDRDIGQILNAEAQDFYGADIKKNYALSWAWVWYLMQSGNGRTVLREVINGEPVDTTKLAGQAAEYRKLLRKKLKPKES